MTVKCLKETYPDIRIKPVDDASATGYVDSTPISSPIGYILKAKKPKREMDIAKGTSAFE